MKKILIGYVLDGKSGGVDRYIMNVYHGLHGAQIDFLTTHKSLELEAELLEKGSRLFEVPRATRPVEHYKCVKKIVEENKYDAVYLNISTGIMFPGVVAAKKGGARRVAVHSHAAGTDFGMGMKKLVSTFFHRLGKVVISRYATDFFACSETAGNWMFTKRILSSDRFSVVNNAIRTSDFVYNEALRKSQREKLGISPSTLVLGHVGNFLYAKNHEFLIDVFHAYHTHNPDSRLILVGSGPLRDGIRKKVEKLNLSDNVIFIDECDSTVPYLHAMDVFLMPSHFEGFGMAAIEAECTGLPCILSSAVPKSVSLTDSNLFLKTDDPKEWVEAIENVKNYTRKDCSKTVRSKGFSLEDQDFDKIVFGGNYA